MSGSAFLTTDLSQDTTEPIIPLLFSFLLVELKLILMGMTAGVMCGKSWTDQPSLQTVQWSAARQCTEEHAHEWRLSPSQRQIRAVCGLFWRTKMYILRKTLKVWRVFFPLHFEDLIKFLIPIINLKKCTLPHLSRIVLMTSNDIWHNTLCGPHSSLRSDNLITHQGNMRCQTHLPFSGITQQGKEISC